MKIRSLKFLFLPLGHTKFILSLINVLVEKNGASEWKLHLFHYFFFSEADFVSVSILIYINFFIVGSKDL